MPTRNRCLSHSIAEDLKRKTIIMLAASAAAMISLTSGSTALAPSTTLAENTNLVPSKVFESKQFITGSLSL